MLDRPARHAAPTCDWTHRKCTKYRCALELVVHAHGISAVAASVESLVFRAGGLEFREIEGFETWETCSMITDNRVA
jgi:hypothetical protein